jgi:hypothetical protein
MFRRRSSPLPRPSLPLLSLALAALLAAPLSACSDDDPPGLTDGAVDSRSGDGGGADITPSDATPSDTTPSDGTPAEAGGGGKLIIRVGGDTSPKTIPDGLAGQTPKVYTMSLSRYEIMTSAADPKPVLVFDHKDKPVTIDMLKAAQEAGSAPLSTIPTGTYTHGRVKLTSTSFTVAATVHATAPLAGDVTVTTALSDGKIDGKDWKQGDVSYVFSIWPTPIPGVLPPLPATPGGQIIQQGGETWMVFPFTKPLFISSASPKDWTATITYQVADSFRWQDDASKTGYLPNVFDVSVLPTPSFEAVKSFGATGYLIEESETP